MNFTDRLIYLKGLKMTIEEYYSGAIEEDQSEVMTIIEYLVFDKQIFTPEDDGGKLKEYINNNHDELINLF